MKQRHLLLAGLLGVIILTSSCEPARLRYNFDWQRVQVGDSIAWKSPTYDDSHWDYDDDVTDEGVFWSRMKVKLPPEETARKNFGVQVVATAAYEAYWDGVYLGTNGRLGEDGYREVPGMYQWFAMIPDTLIDDGEHVLAIRATKESEIPGFHSYFFIDNYFELTRGPVQISKYMFMLGGGFPYHRRLFSILFCGPP